MSYNLRKIKNDLVNSKIRPAGLTVSPSFWQHALHDLPKDTDNIRQIMCSVRVWVLPQQTEHFRQFNSKQDLKKHLDHLGEVNYL